jgi:type I restriction enzyme, R subunit
VIIGARCVLSEEVIVPTRAPRLVLGVDATVQLPGFDAPVEQVLYLDRSIKEAELLQTIARVNRTASGKNVG